MQVVYASSQESGDGDAANLVDGDPSTIWHTMYSVTVAKYPHWVDLDAGEVKEIKGFTYLPRQNGIMVISRITLFKSAWMVKNGVIRSRKVLLLITQRKRG